MIAKIIKGRGFGGLCRYVLDMKPDSRGLKGARLVGGTMDGEDYDDFMRHFAVIRRLRPDVTRPVFHCSLSLMRGESLPDEKWDEAAAGFMKKMGFPETCPYLVVRHGDKEHEHVHIIASMVGFDGERWNDAHDFRKAMKATAELEPEFGLKAAEGPAGKKNREAPTGGEVQLSLRTGQAPARMALQDLIDETAAISPNIVDFCEYLAANGVETRVSLGEDREIAGLSFSLGTAFRASALGREYTWPALSARGVDYDPDEHFEALGKFSAAGIRPEVPDPGASSGASAPGEALARDADVPEEAVMKEADAPEEALVKAAAAMAAAAAEAKGRIRGAIDRIVETRPTAAAFCERLEAEGIEATANLSSTGRLSGFSFSLDGLSLAGGGLGDKYKWGSLRRRGVSYEPERDLGGLRRFSLFERKRALASGSEGVPASVPGFGESPAPPDGDNDERGAYGRGAAPGPEEARRAIGRAIDRIAGERPTAPEFCERLEAEGIEARANLASTGRLSGFSFAMDGFSFAGGDLGAGYRWGSLRELVGYEPERDFGGLRRFSSVLRTRISGPPEVREDPGPGGGASPASPAPVPGPALASSPPLSPADVMREAIDRTASLLPSAPEFCELLGAEGIEARANLASTGRMNGFSFSLGGVVRTGSELGEAYKWSSLRERVSYEPWRDFEGLKKFSPAARRAEPAPADLPVPGGGLPAKERLAREIDRIAAGGPTMDEFLLELGSNGIGARLKMNDAGIPRGIEFEIDGLRFDGPSLGRRYSLGGLLGRGVNYDGRQDEKDPRDAEADAFKPAAGGAGQKRKDDDLGPQAGGGGAEGTAEGPRHGDGDEAEAGGLPEGHGHGNGGDDGKNVGDTAARGGPREQLLPDGPRRIIRDEEDVPGEGQGEGGTRGEDRDEGLRRGLLDSDGDTDSPWAHSFRLGLAEAEGRLFKERERELSEEKRELLERLRLNEGRWAKSNSLGPNRDVNNEDHAEGLELMFYSKNGFTFASDDPSDVPSCVPSEDLVSDPSNVPTGVPSEELDSDPSFLFFAYPSDPSSDERNRPVFRDPVWAEQSYEERWNEKTLSHDYFLNEESDDANAPRISPRAEAAFSARQKETGRRPERKDGGVKGFFQTVKDAIVGTLRKAIFWKRKSKPLFSIKKLEVSKKHLVTIHKDDLASVAETLQFVRETMPGKRITVWGNDAFQIKCAAIAAGLDVKLANRRLQKFWKKQREWLAETPPAPRLSLENPEAFPEGLRLSLENQEPTPESPRPSPESPMQSPKAAPARRAAEDAEEPQEPEWPEGRAPGDGWDDYWEEEEDWEPQRPRM